MINLLIAEKGWLGGSSSYLFNFICALDKTKFKPTIVFFRDSPVIQIFLDKGVEVITLKPRIGKYENYKKNFLEDRKKSFATYILYALDILKTAIPEVLKLYSIIKNKKINAVLLNGDVIFLPAVIITCKFSHTACFVRKSGVGDNQGRKLKHLLSFFVDYFICSSDYEMKIHKQNKLPFKRIERVYEGVDPNLYFPSDQNKKVRKEFSILDDQIVIGSISRFQEGKGHDDLFRAAKIVIQEFPRSIFLIVGDVFGHRPGTISMRTKFENIVKQYGINKNIIFTGWRNDILDILQGVDIFVHCPNTWAEGMGMAALESQACGKPVIVTDNSGLAETVTNNLNGFKIGIGDYNSLACKIIELIRNKELRLIMGKESRKNVVKNFNINKNIKSIESIISEYLNIKYSV